MILQHLPSGISRPSANADELSLLTSVSQSSFHLQGEALTLNHLVQLGQKGITPGALSLGVTVTALPEAPALYFCGAGCLVASVGVVSQDLHFCQLVRMQRGGQTGAFKCVTCAWANH